ncbi:MAG TPA: DNA polymerase IV [Thermomicrobiales bacterium]|nr:DNA polymerase IV [Thermomicrobiales bacterium]
MLIRPHERWVIHADLDAFFAAAETLRRPELAGKPVIVGGSPQSRGVVAAASYEARAHGVRSAMPVAQAVRLCPNAVIVRPDGDWYQHLSRRFRDILAEYSPLVEVVSIDEAFLDASGSERLFGGAVELARSLKTRVRRELGLAVSLGVASNKLVAKIASDLDKPDGLRVVRHGDEAATFAPLPVERLPGIGAKASAQLRAQGIETLGQLAVAPDVLLRPVAGGDIERLRRRARGEDSRPVTSERDPRKSLGHEHTFAHDLTGMPDLSAALYRLCEATGADLRRCQLYGTTVTLKLRYGDFTTVTRQQALRRPTDAHQELFHLASALLERALSERHAPVRLLGVRVTGLTNAARQLGLFDDGLPRLSLLNRAIDRIAERAGEPLLVPARYVSRLSGEASTPSRRVALDTSGERERRFSR